MVLVSGVSTIGKRSSCGRKPSGKFVNEDTVNRKGIFVRRRARRLVETWWTPDAPIFTSSQSSYRQPISAKVLMVLAILIA